jgi:membrane protein
MRCAIRSAAAPEAPIGLSIRDAALDIVILIAARLNAETEHQITHETTPGPEKPLDQRSAKMADTVRPARS